ncbi:hypothetical protein BDN72DRAFT_956307 [Pluteus cervinus]|uniref:Uncharacterized protein n=1 Tax=Pluteus cervinus TaxID=181527 RepID=A0ACD3B7C0_9AGAR|nr:hypothetical protein BDN72DRAFT_956307 [Pluteus cervinus]
MSFFSKFSEPGTLSKHSSPMATPAPEKAKGALLHILYVSLPANVLRKNSVNLKALDMSPGLGTVRPVQVYNTTHRAVQDGLNKVLNVDMLISITGTHLGIQLIEKHSLHADLPLASLEVSVDEILEGILKQPDQQAFVYTSSINQFNVNVAIKREPLSGLLSQVVLPKSLIESLGKAERALEILIDIGEPLSELHPTAKLVVSLIKPLFKVLQDQKVCYEKLSGLFKKIGAILPYFEKMQNLRHFKESVGVIKQIISHMENVVRTVLNFSNTSALRKFLDFTIASQQAEGFAELSDRFDELLQEFETAYKVDAAFVQEQILDSSLKTADLIDQAHIEKVLQKLNYIEIMPAGQCLEGTRELVLAEMESWSQHPDQSIFWLCGPAGTGKSTLAATFTLQLHEAHKLGASFTCRRDHKALNSGLQLLKNICYRLAMEHKPYGQKIVEIVEKDSHFGSGIETISSLFKMLFEEPLQDLEVPPVAYFVVIDALDECGDELDRSQILRHLLDLVKCNWIRILITSRANPEIADQLKERAQIYRLETETSIDDIRVYFQTMCLSFEFTSNEIESLTGLANGLFIWANTTYKYLKPLFKGQRKQQLKLLLESQVPVKGKPYAQLHHLYNTILEKEIGESNLEMYQMVMGTILLATQPLGISTIASLTGQSESDIEDFVSRLHAVVLKGSDGKVKILHQSYAEYILYTQNQTYHINEEDGHGKLLIGCIRIMEHKLQFNMYGIKSSYVLNKDIQGLEERKHDLEMQDVHYAALSWTYHNVKAKVLTVDQEDKLYTLFCGPKILHWMEVLSMWKTMYKIQMEISQILRQQMNFRKQN